MYGLQGANLCYLCYIDGMQKQISDWLMNNKGMEHSSLPSVRALAAQWGCSSLTVNRALKGLAVLGEVYVIPKKGYYWGSSPVVKTLISRKNSARQRVYSSLIRDFSAGVFHPFEALPSSKELARLYRISVKGMRSLLKELCSEDFIRSEGRLYYLPHARSRSSETVVYWVGRCDVQGQMLLQSERELEFVRQVQTQAFERGLRVRALGYEVDSRCLWESSGKKVNVRSLSGVGFLISTWLIPQSGYLLSMLEKTGMPLSIWWEHSLAELPHIRRDRVAFFNLAFGETPGRVVGEHLKALGVQRVAFLSPFHGSEWSKGRLCGLERSWGHHGGVFACVGDSWDSPAAWAVSGNSLEERESNLRAVLYPWWQACMVQKVDAVVAVNDLIVGYLPSIAEYRPYVVAFDYSDFALRNRVNSFAFDTGAMVRQMLYFVSRPDAKIFSPRQVHEVVGRVVLAD